MQSAARIAISALALVAGFMPETEACPLKRGEVVAVAEIADSIHLSLADGRELKLVGIEAPPLPPKAEEARAFLAKLVTKGPLALRAGPAKTDRYGRLVGDLLLADGASAQARLVEAGFARVSSGEGRRDCVADLLALERRARARSLGIWADPFYAVRDAGDVAALERLEGSFQIVEGRVAHVATIRRRIYFNFGEDRHTDFTVTVAPADAKLFASRTNTIGAPAALEGRHVRVRGFVERFNGPEMTLTRPEDIELLSEEREPGDGGAAKADGKKRGH